MYAVRLFNCVNFFTRTFLKMSQPRAKTTEEFEATKALLWKFMKEDIYPNEQLYAEQCKEIGQSLFVLVTPFNTVDSAGYSSLYAASPALAAAHMSLTPYVLSVHPIICSLSVLERRHFMVHHA